ncbi:MAG: biotin/lipoate A/B protein ligase family protein [Tenericutes bacterium]|jgi:lipoate-protein ligase A|nr:biotin/lipoate A/B protein ligase family protein [Mycoplasmatota bacterium]
MAIIISNTTDIHYNLATEEYLLRHFDLKEDILFIWYGSNAFVYGRNQNPFIEIKPSYLIDDSIPKIRRVSGGGTIYQDEETINISYITNDYKNKINHYQYFLQPIIDLLKSYGLNALFKPKSHLFIDDKKISGNAQAFINNRLLHHGTLLFDSNLEIINEALIMFSQKAKGHQILSNKQPVLNLKSVLSIDKETFVKQLIKQICKDREIIMGEVVLDKDRINQIKKDKYLSWEWNFGKTPKFNIQTMINHQLVDIYIENGLIKDIDLNDKEKWIGLKYNSKDYFKLIK